MQKLIVRSQTSRISAGLFIWIAVSYFLAVGGWALALSGLFYPKTYWILIPVLIIVLIAIVRLPAICESLSWRFPPWRRFRRPLPLAYLVLTSLAILGGILYGPSNYDALSYRVPRVLNWFAEGHWNWIETVDQRMNTRLTLFEWLMAPIIALGGFGRLLFVINAISQLLLPGLLFGLFRNMGMLRKNAYTWMWIFPMAPLYLIQAGSISNDTFATVFFLAAILFAFRAAKTKSLLDWSLSIASAALLSAAKLSNIPLGLVWLVSMIPALSVLRSRPVCAILIALACIPASFIPNAVINYQHGGDWTGTKQEGWQPKPPNPADAIIGNTILLALQNSSLPINPWPEKLEQSIKSFVPASTRQGLESTFEGGFKLGMGELIVEEGGGLGVGFVLLLLINVAMGVHFGRWSDISRSLRQKIQNPVPFFMVLSSWIGLLLIASKSSLITIARTIPAYYPLALVPFIQPPIKHTGAWGFAWKTALILFVLTSLFTIVMTPARPLWPALTALSLLRQHYPDSPILKRAYTVYDVYRSRPTAFSDFIKGSKIPFEADISLISGNDDPTGTLWMPFGSRSITEIVGQDAFNNLSLDNKTYILFTERGIRRTTGLTLLDWLKTTGVEVIESRELLLRIQRGPEVWHIGLASKKAD